jgi:hypothetical protein
MKVRSPVLGYNHNVRYAGRLWHVQTEDSGVQNPHIFTHLFHDGTILATKRIDYDASSEVGVVQKLMQAQHKAMLRELKAGSFDEKIAKFFGQPVSKVAEDETTDPNARPPIVEDGSADAPVVESASKTDPSLQIPVAPPPPRVPTPPRPQAAVPPRTSPAAVPPPPQQPRPTTQPQQSSVPRVPTGGVGGIASRRPSSVAMSARPPAEGVVVARPAVIIGGEPRQGTGERKGPTQTAERKSPSSTRWNPPTNPGNATPPQGENIFGADLISEKSLDEVILAYLSEDLNEK